MSEVCTITKNAVQELVELPVARKPLTIKIKLPPGYKAKVQELTEYFLTGLSSVQWED